MLFRQLLFLFTLLSHVFFIFAEISSPLVSGKKAEYGQFPFVVAFLLDDKTSMACSGALLSKKHAISAAHCFSQRMNQVFYCLGGDIYRLTRSKKATRQIRKISKITLNPRVLENINDHKAITDLKHDFAILLMKTPFELNNYINTIKVAGTSMQNDVPCIGLGFGRLSENGVFGEDRAAALGIKLSNCSKLEKSYAEFCMFSPKREKYMYRGDSGGPLINHDPPYKYYGAYIGRDVKLKHFGIYSEVINSIDWIHNEVDGNKKGMKQTTNGSRRLIDFSEKHTFLTLAWLVITSLKRM